MNLCEKNRVSPNKDGRFCLLRTGRFFATAKKDFFGGMSETRIARIGTKKPGCFWNQTEFVKIREIRVAEARMKTVGTAETRGA